MVSMPRGRFGPRALREHSLRLVVGDGFYEIETGKSYLVHEMANRRIVDASDSDILPTNVEGTFDNITADVRKILEKGALPVVLGGDHAITYPVVRAFDGHGDLSVIHFDAHMDYAPFIHDLRFTNGHAFRLIRPLPFMKEMIQVGIRSMRTVEETVDDGIYLNHLVGHVHRFILSLFQHFDQASSAGDLVLGGFVQFRTELSERFHLSILR